MMWSRKSILLGKRSVDSREQVEPTSQCLVNIKTRLSKAIVVLKEEFALLCWLPRGLNCTTRAKGKENSGCNKSLLLQKAQYFWFYVGIEKRKRQKSTETCVLAFLQAKIPESLSPSEVIRACNQLLRSELEGGCNAWGGSHYSVCHSQNWLWSDGVTWTELSKYTSWVSRAWLLEVDMWSSGNTKDSVSWWRGMEVARTLVSQLSLEEPRSYWEPRLCNKQVTTLQNQTRAALTSSHLPGAQEAAKSSTSCRGPTRTQR